MYTGHCDLTVKSTTRHKHKPSQSEWGTRDCRQIVLTFSVLLLLPRGLGRMRFREQALCGKVDNGRRRELAYVRVDKGQQGSWTTFVLTKASKDNRQKKRAANASIYCMARNRWDEIDGVRARKQRRKDMDFIWGLKYQAIGMRKSDGTHSYKTFLFFVQFDLY